MAYANLMARVEYVAATSALQKTILDVARAFDVGDDVSGVTRRTVVVGTGTTVNEKGYHDGRTFLFGVVIPSKTVTMSYYCVSGEEDNHSVTIPAGMPFIFPTGTATEYSAGSTMATTAESDINMGLSFYNNSGSTAYIDILFVEEDA